ncbi:multicopper oxidase-domain-containing protein [Phycomyces blakesleeanus]|uniref:Multicopper oxidase-domain-containing protein n=1 Tax=Phycomyces blakesleeanus TaxID=4837 RepID=A0ABR3BGP2_PHYBL
MIHKAVCRITGLLLLSNVVFAALRTFELNLTNGDFNPDCHTNHTKVMLVNGQFPGPPIYVTKGDDVVITVHNRMETNSPSAIHYHGIRQYGSVASDGVPGVTQPLIQPGGSYVHKFRVQNQSGTFFYHAHAGMQDDTIQGPFIVYDDENSWPSSLGKQLSDGPFTYDDERIIHLSEWWRQHHHQRESYYLGPTFRFDHSAESILINGRTINNPLQIMNPATCPGYTALNVEPNKTYRFRIIGGNSFRTLALAIKDHPMTIIEVDGEKVVPYETSFLEITPGQRFSVLVHTANAEPGSAFAIATNYRYRHRGKGYTENGFGYMRYVAPGGLTEPYSNIMKPDSIYPHSSGKLYAATSNKQHSGKCSNPTFLKKRQETGGKSGHGGHGGPGEPGGEGGGSGKGGGSKGGKGKGGGGGGGPGGKRPPRDFTYAKDFPVFPEEDGVGWIWDKLQPLQGRDQILDEQPDRTIKLRASIMKHGDNTTRYYMNGRPPIEHALPLYNSLTRGLRKTPRLEELEEDGYSAELKTYPLFYQETIDVVLQNAMGGIDCLLHPWHTHGHSHHLIASGVGEYNHEEHKDIRNFATPLYKDVSVVYPSEPDPVTRGCGWTKIRIKADNPGYWAIHCHITAHMLQGKMAVFEESPDLIEAFSVY